MNCTFRVLIFAAASLALQPAAHGQIAHGDGGAVTVGDLIVLAPFTRATLPSAQVGGGYLVIENTGTTDDNLIAARSSLAGMVEIHEMTVVDDVMRMRPLAEGLAIPAGETVSLTPGGLHLMMTGITAPFVEGETVPVTLVFETAGEVDIELAVAAFGPSVDEHSGHGESE